MRLDEKCKIPEDVRAEMLAVLRGYERRQWSSRPEDVRRVEAVKLARSKVLEEFPGDLGRQLCDGIMKNCMGGRKYPFERLGLAFLSRSDFYRRRQCFLHEMAVYLGVA